MAYTPTVWQTGDIVSSSKLNKIETELAAQSTDAEGMRTEVDQLSSEIDQIDPKIEAGFPQKSASGSIITIDDGADNVPVVSLTAEINPVQDLHGYDNPWPAGGGKNLLDASTVFGGESSIYTVNSDGSVTVLSSDVRAWTSCPTLNLPAGSYIISKTPTTGTSDIRLSTEEYGTSHIFTSQFTFTLSEAGSVKIKLAYSAQSYPCTQKVQIESGSTATAWSPYSNICPISGWTGANVSVTGKNLFSYDNIYNGYWLNDGFHGTGVKDDYDTMAQIVYGQWEFVKVPVVAGDKITLSGMQAMGGTLSAFFGDDPTDVISAFNNAYQNSTRTVPDGAKWLGVCIHVGGYEKYPNDPKTLYPNAQLEIGSSASAFSPYVSNVTPITFPDSAGTVYGGTLKLNQDGTADLTVDKGMLEIQSSNVQLPPEAQTYTNMTPVAINYIPNVEISFTKWGLSDICGKAVSVYPFDSADNIWKLIRNAGNSAFWIGFPYGTTAEQAKEFLTGHQLCYALATPQTYHITDVELVKTLLGMNNIWCDTGDVSLTYRADPATYIAEQIRLMLNAMVAPVEASTTASKAYSVNDFLIMNNVLYKVISPIASGGTITVNTNVSATTVGAELTAILNS